MAIDGTAGVVAAGEVDDRLHVEIHDTNYTSGSEQFGERIDNGVEIRLFVSAFVSSSPTNKWVTPWYPAKSVLVRGAKKSTYNHGQAVGHGDEVGTTHAGAARLVGIHGGDLVRPDHRRLVVFEAEGTGILAHDLHVLPAQAGEPLPGDLAERGREVNEVDAGEEFGHRDELGHSLNVPASSSTDLKGPA